LAACTTSEILKTIDSIYKGVRVVITAPDVMEKIPKDTLDKLAKIETNYLAAAEDVRTTGVDNAKPLSIIVDCADDFLMVIDSLALGGRHEKEIKAIGESVRLLKTLIQRE
jgi:hypothetical protein